MASTSLKDATNLAVGHPNNDDPQAGKEAQLVIEFGGLGNCAHEVADQVLLGHPPLTCAGSDRSSSDSPRATHSDTNSRYTLIKTGRL